MFSEVFICAGGGKGYTGLAAAHTIKSAAPFYFGMRILPGRGGRILRKGQQYRRGAALADGGRVPPSSRGALPKSAAARRNFTNTGEYRTGRIFPNGGFTDCLHNINQNEQETPHPRDKIN